MTKKQAFEMVQYLLDEAFGLLNIADYTDLKAVAGLLTTANYLTKSYQLKERQAIELKICEIRRQAYETLQSVEKSLDNVF